MHIRELTKIQEGIWLFSIDTVLYTPSLTCLASWLLKIVTGEQIHKEVAFNSCREQFGIRSAERHTRLTLQTHNLAKNALF